jgi:hypothetical protein
MINIWYGDVQKYGHLGTPQRWINVLGRVEEPNNLCQFTYTLNNAPEQSLSIGPDHHRLANPGDFNVEIDHEDLKEGHNSLVLNAKYDNGRRATKTVILDITKGHTWPLPYHINWSQTSAIHDVAQPVDGLWKLTPQGIRVVEPYYDRVIALGDLSWTDYEIQTTVTFHVMRVPDKSAGDGGANVIHAALAVRWPGHDEDNNQPRVKWYPLGATAEFRVNPTWENCSWRILGGSGAVINSDHTQTIEPNIPYHMKHRVQSQPDGNTTYSVKLWHHRDSEPQNWDLQMHKEPGDVSQGGALLIAHYTDVTFGNVEVVPISLG